MKGKTIVTLMLLVFVAVSVVYLVMNETRKPTQPGGDQTTEENVRNAGSTDRLIVYYFHGNKRCNTCRTIEALTEEAITTGFSEQLESGRIEWKTVNVDETENGHFVGDYELTTRSVVLVEIRQGHEEKWTNLDRVWDLVQKKEAFIDYITENTNACLVESDG
jgi:hypothetical protein